MEKDLRKQLEELKEKNEKLKKALRTAYKDTLTGLWNQNFYEKFRKKFKKTEKRLGFIYIDANKLKKINDLYSHKAGDEYLATIGGLIKNSLKRKSDFAFRLGGDEFVIILALPGEDPQVGLDMVSERIENNLKKTNKKRVEERKVEISFAMGCTLKKEDETLLVSVLRAEEKMYEHKRLQARRDPILARK